MGRHVFLGVTSSCAEVVTLCATEISFFLYGLPCVLWGHQLVCRSSYTACNQKATMNQHTCVFSDDQFWWLSSRTACSCGASFYHVEACVFLGLWSYWRRYCTEYIQLPMSKVCLQSALPLFVQLVLLYQSRNTVVGQLKKVLQQKLYTKRTNFRKVRVILILNFG